MKYLPFFLILLLACQSTEKYRKEKIVGLWQTDSISNFVNGRTYTNNVYDEHWSRFEYRKDGALFERRQDAFRKREYRVTAADTVVYQDSTGKELGKYEILKLDDKQLVLKKSQKPYLPGKNQELYEIRFFSRISKLTPAANSQ